MMVWVAVVHGFGMACLLHWLEELHTLSQNVGSVVPGM